MTLPNSKLLDVVPRVLNEAVSAGRATQTELAAVMGYAFHSSVSKMISLEARFPRADRLEALSCWLSDEHGIVDVAEIFTGDRYTVVPKPAVQTNGFVTDEGCRILELDGLAVHHFGSGTLEDLRAAEQSAMDAVAEQHQLLAEIRAKIARMQERRAA